MPPVTAPAAYAAHRPRPLASAPSRRSAPPDAPAPARGPSPSASPSAVRLPGEPAGTRAARSAPQPPAVPPLRTSSNDLLALARDGLAEAAAATSPAERYAAAHLSALRAAAAVIAARARPASSPAPARRSRPLTAWVLLATVAPELGEWAAFFASGAAKRAAADARLPGAVTAREADDLLRDAETFLAVVETKLGAQPTLYRGVG